MTRSGLRRVLTATTAAVLSGATLSGAGPALASGPPRAEEAADVAGGSSLLARALLHRMSLEDKVGQLFVATVWGKSADEAHPTNLSTYGVATAAEVVRQYRVGGVIYFNNSGTDNVDNPRQLAAFSNGLQRAAMRSNTHIPLMVSIDQEGGNVTRIEAPATEYPSSMALGAGRSGADARSLASINAAELRAMGINQNFAPVADVNSNPLNPVIGARSFSSHPDVASELVAAEVAGYQDAGRRSARVSTAAKHFPGHGDAATDSHTGLPIINRTEAQWRAIDLPPFRAAIEAGVDSIMTAHIEVPSLDPSGVPATLSRPIMTGLLRQELGYQGVIVTDALGMGGANVFPPEEIPVMALEAGVDQLLMAPNLRLAEDAVLAAVRGGRLTERRIDESVLRVLSMKIGRGVLFGPLVDEGAVDSTVGTPAHLAEVQRITDRTVTVLRNDAGLLPLASPPARVLVAGVGSTVNPAATPADLARSIQARGSAATAVATGTAPSAATIASTVAAAADADLVVLLGNNLRDRPGQRSLLQALLATGKPVVAVATQIPYDAGAVEAPTWIATYAWRAVSMESLAKVMFGEISPTGRLPLDIPLASDPTVVRYPFDTGLTW